MKQRTFSDYLLFTEAWLLLALSRLMLLFIPFRSIAPVLGKAMQQAPAQLLPNPQLPNAVSIAILRAGNRSPWRTKCFEQAIAAKIMLQLRGIKSTVYFGINKTTNEMLAHAWLMVNDSIITGGPHISQFTIVSWFGS
jgi:hypothetical protein